MLKIHRKT